VSSLGEEMCRTAPPIVAAGGLERGRGSELRGTIDVEALRSAVGGAVGLTRAIDMDYLRLCDAMRYRL